MLVGRSGRQAGKKKSDLRKLYFWLGNLILKSQFHIVTAGAEHTSVTLIDKKSLFLYLAGVAKCGICAERTLSTTVLLPHVKTDYYPREEGCGAVQHHPHQYYQQLCSGIQSPVLRGGTFFALLSGKTCFVIVSGFSQPVWKISRTVLLRIIQIMIAVDRIKFSTRSPLRHCMHD